MFLHLLNVPAVPLAVTVTGGGTVQSDVPGVNCTSSCTSQWDPGWHVGLTPIPTTAKRFIRWTGDCTGNGDCVLTLDAAKSVTAVFGPRYVPVRVGVSGKGTIACLPGCSSTFPAGTTLRLTAHAAKGWRFTGWTGACSGKTLTCRPPTDAAVTARATFRKLPVVKKKKR